METQEEANQREFRDKNAESFEGQVQGYKKAKDKKDIKKVKGRMTWNNWDHADFYRAYRKSVKEWIFGGRRSNVTEFYNTVITDVT
jgi:hypothetical protein